MKTGSKPTADMSLQRQGPIDAEVGVGVQQVAQQGAIRTQTPYQTAVAVQVPRTLKRVEQGVMEEAALMGDSWLYSWTTRNKDGSKGAVEGEGIEAAKVLMRNWGNCTCPTTLVNETPTHWIFEAVFIDLETGMSFPKLFRQRKPGAGLGRMNADRAEDMAFGMGQSKAQRNAILAGMPAWLLDHAREEAKDAAERAIRDLPSAIDKAVKFFEKSGVTLARLEARIGKPQAQWNKRDVVTLRVIANALKERNTTVDDEFPPEQPKQEPATQPDPQPNPQESVPESQAPPVDPADPQADQ
jgi:hypothetical protein